MKKVLLYSALLLGGLFLSQFLPPFIAGFDEIYRISVTFLTMTGLSYIMIHVGYEFQINKKDISEYRKDYWVAMTAAAFPWIFVSVYFVFVLMPPEYWQTMQAWKESLLAGRFAAPTSAGVLFTMLAAAGLATTWVFKKARILAIFDDLDTIILMIPLKMLMVGLVWQLGIILILIIIMIWIAWKWLHKIKIPTNWYWVLTYALVTAAISKIIYFASKSIDPVTPIHIEVLLPAFVLGCITYIKHEEHGSVTGNEKEIKRQKTESIASGVVSAMFMLTVGLSMPYLFGEPTPGPFGETISASLPALSVSEIIFHVLVITLVSNIGKLYPAFVYRNGANFRQRLAVALAMCPRGEVGAGVLIVSISYGIGGPLITIAMLSLALNLMLTGVIIYFVKKLLSKGEMQVQMPIS